MDLGKTVRIQRIFSHPSGRLCSVAVDHFIGYQKGLPQGLTHMADAVAKLMAARPDAVTMLKGVAKSIWPAYAGRTPFILSTVAFTPDDGVLEQFATPREALQLGADAIAVAIGVRGPNEGRYLKLLNSIVEEADRISLPVFSHIYPRDFSGVPRIVHDPENIMWAVRCGIECGADVIKVPYTGDVASYRDIVASSPVPVVAAGGPKANRLEDALQMASQVVAAGARGAVIGRNIWGESDPTRALRAFKAVIHDNVAPDKALKAGV
jgi:fructose-bisphosphate aldolase, class I